MLTTKTLTQTDMADAVVMYLRSKRYEVKGSVTFKADPGDPEDPRGGPVPAFTASAQVEDMPRKKRGAAAK